MASFLACIFFAGVGILEHNPEWIIATGLFSIAGNIWNKQ